MPREWNTPKREPWNAPIHNILKAIVSGADGYLLKKTSPIKILSALEESLEKQGFTQKPGRYISLRNT